MNAGSSRLCLPWFGSGICPCFDARIEGNCKCRLNRARIAFSVNLIFFVRGGYMTLGSTLPVPINSFRYPVNLIIRLIIHAVFSVSFLSLFWSLRRETLPVPSLRLCWHPVCQSEIPPGAPPPRAPKWLRLLWPHPCFGPQRGSRKDRPGGHLCPARCPP